MKALRLLACTNSSPTALLLSMQSRCMSVHMYLLMCIYLCMHSQSITIRVCIVSIFHASYKLLAASCKSCLLLCLFQSSFILIYEFPFVISAYENNSRDNIVITLKYINNRVDGCLLSFCIESYLLCLLV